MCPTFIADDIVAVPYALCGNVLIFYGTCSHLSGRFFPDS